MVTTEDARVYVTWPTLSIDWYMSIVVSLYKKVSQFKGLLNTGVLIVVELCWNE